MSTDKRFYLNSNGIVSWHVYGPIGTMITCKFNRFRSLPIRCGLNLIALSSSSPNGKMLSIFTVGFDLEK